VGFVSLTVRLVESLGFVRTATFRLSLAALGQVQRDATRLRRALEEAVGLQALALGMPLATFAIAAPMALPWLFGDKWTPALQIYPFISLGFLVGAVFGMHASILYVTRRNSQVTLANAVHTGLFVCTAFLLVPRIGLLVYGVAEIVALGSNLVLHHFVVRLFSFSYRRALAWGLAFAPVLFFPLAGWPWGAALFLPAAFVAATPEARNQVGEVWRFVRRRTA